MKILITGGCKNGKSFYAQELISRLGSEGNTFYVATMKPRDDEDLERIERHKKERLGLGFITIEQPGAIGDCLQSCDSSSSILLDSTTALLSNEMFLENGAVDLEAYKKIADELLYVCSKVKNIAVVSDYIYSDAQLYDELTERYRFGLAYIDRKLAYDFDSVCEVSFNNKIFHKGGEALL